jgi:hypothetical protein
MLAGGVTTRTRTPELAMNATIAQPEDRRPSIAAVLDELNGIFAPLYREVARLQREIHEQDRATAR